jgi:hypothetical protein
MRIKQTSAGWRRTVRPASDWRTRSNALALFAPFVAARGGKDPVVGWDGCGEVLGGEKVGEARAPVQAG